MDMNEILVRTQIFVFPVMVCFFAIVLIWALTPLAERFNLLDIPDERKRHGDPVPLIGGLAIYIIVVTAMSLMELPEKLSWLIFSTSLIVCVGCIDDVFGLTVRVRLTAETIAVGIMIFGGGLWISEVYIHEEFSQLSFWVGVVFTTVAVVGLTNGFNMLDGLDGLAAGHVLVSLSTLIYAIGSTGNYPDNIIWIIIIMSATFAFFLVNISLTPLKRVFLGDGGSLSLGFMVSWALIYYSQSPGREIEPIIALWCVTLPVFDTVAVIINRILRKKGLFIPDRTHLHHVLVDKGFCHIRVLAFILCITGSLNALGVAISSIVTPLISFIIYLVFMMAYVAIVIKQSRKGRTN